MRKNLRNLISIASFVFIAVFASVAQPAAAAQPTKEGVASNSNPNWNCFPGVQDECFDTGATGWTKPAGITNITMYSVSGYFGATNDNRKVAGIIYGAGSGCSWGYNGGYFDTHIMCYGFPSAQGSYNIKFTTYCPWIRSINPSNTTTYHTVQLYNADSPWQLLANFSIPAYIGTNWCHF